MNKLRAFNPWGGVWLAVAVFAAAILIQVGAISMRLAAAGAIIAVVGVVTLGRPVIRMGYASWVAQSRIIDGGSFVETPEQKAAQKEADKDALAIQVTGPALVAFGTLLNGFSGFFG